MKRLLLATSNAGKLRELLDLLRPYTQVVEVVTPTDVGLNLHFDETVEVSEDYREIARRKVLQAAWQVGGLALAEDSGLEVDALGGFPSVRSARFMGRMTSYTDKNQTLLALLQDVVWEKRTARYRCCMALGSPQGILAEGEGVWEGIIALEPAGEGGFGYDPIFYVPELGKTAAQLTLSEKNRHSHRALAFRCLEVRLGML